VFLPPAAPILTALALLTASAPGAWLVLPSDGLLVVVLLAAAAGWGAWPTALFGFERRPFLAQLCLALALGLGLLATLAFLLALGGYLHRPSSWGLVATGVMLGVTRLRRSPWRNTRQPGAPRGSPTGPLPALTLLPLSLPIMVVLYGAGLPPGLLWGSEAYGYDVLEYHLQVPREYYEAGRVHFLPHNAYASFPQQMETLYLLLMHLAGGPLHGAIPAQLLHAACGVLTVLALAAWTPTGWPRLVVVLVSASVPWLTYVGCLAYVELGMLFFAAVAAGLLLDHLRGDADIDWRATLAAGLCAGWACGCKYTALALVALAQALTWVFVQPGTIKDRWHRLLPFVLGCVAAFSPWLLRNWAFTGNPVYPFAYGWFDGRGWSTEQAARWAQAHRLPAGQDDFGTRMRLVYRELLGSRMFGPMLFVLALGGLLLGWSRRAAFLLLWSTSIIIVWAAATHMPGRFAIAVTLPLALLAGQMEGNSCPARLRRAIRPTVVCLAVAGALWNADTLVRQLKHHVDWWSSRGIPLGSLVGMTEQMAAAQPLLELLPPHASVKLVGEARAFYLPSQVRYTVVFSRDPWLEYSRASSAEQSVAWLRTQGFTHVVFSWPEIERLRRSYGFPAQVTREWASELVRAGLRRLHPPEGNPLADIEVYEVTARP